jgi:DNA polymerase
VQELGLGYQGGVAAFLTFAAVYQLNLEEMAAAVLATAPADVISRARDTLAWVKRTRRSAFGLPDDTYLACEVLKASWRAAHPAVEAFWAAAENAVGGAIHNPGTTFEAGEHVKVQRDGAWLRCRLPSGRYVCYLSPKVDNGQISYLGVNQYTKQWSRIKTYGGKLVENWVQAWARDVFAERMPDLEDAGYLPVAGVHDEWITEAPDTPEFSGENLAAIMARPIDWAPNLPLAAAGFECYRYRKD